SAAGAAPAVRSAAPTALSGGELRLVPARVGVVSHYHRHTASVRLQLASDPPQLLPGLKYQRHLAADQYLLEGVHGQGLFLAGVFPAPTLGHARGSNRGSALGVRRHLPAALVSGVLAPFPAAAHLHHPLAVGRYSRGRQCATRSVRKEKSATETKTISCWRG